MVEELSKKQKKVGHNVYVFGFSNNPKLGEEKELLSYHSLPFLPQDLSPAMVKDVIQLSPDVLHFHGMLIREQLLLMTFFSKMEEIPVVWTVHGLHEHYRIACKRKLLYPFLIFPLTVGMKMATRVIALSPFDIKILSSIGVPKNKIEVIPNGVDWTHFADPPKPSACEKTKQKYELEANKLALSVQMIRPNKGLEYLIKAANRLTDVEFAIAGGIQDHNYFRELQDIKSNLEVENVKFLGYVPQKDLKNLFFASDVFILPSLSETLPLVILEAMAAGLPIVSTLVGGISSLIQEKRNGFLVPPADVQSLTEGIKKIFYDPDLAEQMGKINRKTVKHKYTWQKIASETINLYSKLV